MKCIKHKKIIFLFLFFIFICIIAYNIICKFDFSNMELNGQMVFPDPIGEATNTQGVHLYKDTCLYDLENENYKNILENYRVIDVYMNPEKTKILFSDFYKVYEYDINNDTIKIIYGSEIEYVASDGYIYSPKYIPNSSYIGFIIGKDLFIYDTESKKCINNLGVDHYDCYNNRKAIVYSYNGSIFRYNFDDNKSYYLFDGEEPILSANDQYMVYRNPNKQQTVLVVRDLTTNEVIERKFPIIFDYAFSPENDKIALIHEHIYSKNLVIWDFKTNKTKTLIKNIYYNDFDWK